MNKQIWAVGETVKVGFMTLRIVGTARNGDWFLVNKDASKKFAFQPYGGLVGIDAFEAY